MSTHTKKAEWVSLYVGEFLADVAHLGNTELGVYWRLLLIYYQHRRPFANDLDRVCRVAMAMSPEERSCVERVLAEFFVLSESGGQMVWRHRRADKEIEDTDRRRSDWANRTKAARAARWQGKNSVTESVTGSVTGTQDSTSPLYKGDREKPSTGASAASSAPAGPEPVWWSDETLTHKKAAEVGVKSRLHESWTQYRMRIAAALEKRVKENA